MAGYQGSSTRRSPVEALAAAIEAERREINTVIDGVIVSFDRTTQRATIKPKLQRKFGEKVLDAPDLKEIKVAMPGGGGFGVHYDLKPGDPVTLMIRQRSVDKSQTEGGNTDNAPGRMHDLSDAVAYPGGGQDSKVMTNMPEGGAHIGTTDGKKGLQLRADGSQAIVGGPDGADKLIVAPDGRVDLKAGGETLFEILGDFVTIFKNHQNGGAPMRPSDIIAAETLLLRISHIRGY